MNKIIVITRTEDTSGENSAEFTKHWSRDNDNDNDKKSISISKQEIDKELLIINGPKFYKDGDEPKNFVKRISEHIKEFKGSEEDIAIFYHSEMDLKEEGGLKGICLETHEYSSSGAEKEKIKNEIGRAHV